jgi:hypothetical protein
MHNGIAPLPCVVGCRPDAGDALARCLAWRLRKLASGSARDERPAPADCPEHDRLRDEETWRQRERPGAREEGSNAEEVETNGIERR